MKVKEMIEILKGLPKDAELCCFTDPEVQDWRDIIEPVKDIIDDTGEHNHFLIV